ncbi:ABC transporter substrate-binding protein [Marinobacterium zhoushanense]|uniref:ABC transporter substrate-binding protein n=1 Tax=Marinobacterium zhoushanense TaxID=1679163 RepID=A0ABQ1KNL7_9GAMM|nr:extracellular solute-binding protein [Marinobacterium zhoushanense]GGC02672.1 ABC transporter substrate-binding protein [Marinobacterium zhoushanense]
MPHREFRSAFRTLVISLTLAFSTASLADDMPPASHGIAMHGDLKYPADFTHFDYVNPDAPKTGTVKQWAFGTFDSFNPFIVKGTVADDIGLIYDSLTTKSQDEPFSEYGLLAKAIYVPESRSWIEFELHEEARFSDGKPVRAEDVVYTFKLLREQGSPFYRAYYAGISKISALSETRVRFEFSDSENRELPLIVGEVPILPKHYWEGRDFTKPGLDIPVGSGPYVIASFDAGRTVTFKRNPNYWGANLPANRGRNNFDVISYDYYRDATVALEAFKAGEYDFRQETSSKQWATGYTGAPFDDGRIIKELIPNENPTGMQAFVMNTRRAQFSDARVREALAYAFDFEWTNQNLFYGAYTRSHSFFSNSEMAATELPTPEELKILEPIRDQVPPEVFTQVYRAPETNGDGQVRSQLRKALRLLREAGWELDNGVLKNSTGETFDFEILLVQKEFERVVAPFIRNLERMGISARIRIVDVSQYINRIRQFDFDMVVSSFGQSNSPGNEQREYWHSSTADQPGSRNLIGIKNPAVDYLIEQIIQAPDREQLVLRCRALDRVLQWSHYVIPQFHISAYRVAYWNKFAMPEQRPRYSLGFDTWWIKR